MTQGGAHHAEDGVRATAVLVHAGGRNVPAVCGPSTVVQGQEGCNKRKKRETKKPPPGKESARDPRIIP